MTTLVARTLRALLLPALLLTVATPSEAYTFTKIADTTNGFTFAADRLPAINAAGTVAFRGARAGQEGIFTGTGGSSVTAVAGAGTAFSAFGLPAIAADGTVAFPAFLTAGGEGVFSGAGGATTIATSAADLATFGGLCGIGAGGLVAFQATRDDASQGIFTGAGAALTAVVDTLGGTFAALGLPAVNGAASVAFHAMLAAGGEGVFTAQAGGAPAPVAQTGALFEAFDALPTLNDAGTVAFHAALTAGGEGVFTAAPGATPVTVAATADGAFSAFGTVAIDASGAVAFLATLAGGGTGVFTGPDATRQKVIAVGDALGGSTVTALELGRDALNDTGQIAFYAELASGVAGIYRANAPNLRVTALTLDPAVGGPGAIITATDTTKNVGPGNAPTTTTRFYYSTDNVLDDADVEIGHRDVPALAVGVEDTGATVVTLPPSATQGTGFVLAQADATSDVVEASETDNTRSASLKLGADLHVAAVTAPSVAGPGDTVAVGDTTENQGGAPTPATVTRFYLSLDNLLDPSDVLLGERAVGPLAALASDTGTVNVMLPTTLTQGAYFVIARADAADQVTETSETNNTKVKSFTVGVDLVITGLSAPDGGAAGQSVTVAFTTKNQGGAGAGASSSKVFFSTDNVVDAGDTLLATRPVGSLAGGATDVATVSVTIPSGAAAGGYFLLVKADADNAVAESNESNNVQSKAFGVGADLTVTNFSAPATAATGAVIQVTDGTRNSGSGPAPATTTAFYLSADAVLDAGDTLLGTREVPALPGGTTNTLSTTLTLPAGVAGNVFLIARADAGNLVAEKNEGNNTSSRAVTIGADLVVSALTLATSTSGNVVVKDTTQNVGVGPAGASVTAYYLSTDGVLDAGDTLLGTRLVPSLLPGASSSDSVSLPLPASAVGTLFIIARADGQAVVPEVLETNNTTAASFALGADLRVSKLAVTPTKNVTAGTVLTLTDTVQNAGVSASAPTVTRFYLSTDLVPDVADVPLGVRSVPALGARATSTGSIQVTVPAGTPAGLWYVVAVADGDGTQPETVETNNVTTKKLTLR